MWSCRSADLGLLAFVLAVTTSTSSATTCIIDGNRTTVITPSAGYDSAAGDCWTTDGYNCLATSGIPSFTSIVDGIYTEYTGDSGYFESLKDHSYVQFDFTSDVTITTVRFYLQHDMVGCSFYWYGVDSAGTLTTLSTFDWPQNTGSNTGYFYEFTATNTNSYPAYRLKKYTGTCFSPKYYEVTFPNAECVTSAPTVEPSAAPATSIPTFTPTANPTFLPTPAPTYSPCPLTFSAGYGPAATDGCVSTLLDSESECKVICLNGYTGNGGTQKYICSQGSLTQTPSLTCAADPCRINTLGDGVTNKTSELYDGCTVGLQLQNGGACEVECDSGFFSQGGTTVFSCTTGVLAEATLKCSRAPCTLPDPLGENVVGSALDGKCNAGGTLASGSVCDIVCTDGYILADTSPTLYSCFSGEYSVGPVEKTGAVQCVPGPCTLNATFGTGVTGKRGPVGCVEGGSIESGKLCELQCKPGYYAKSGSKDVNECFASKLSVEATLVCLPSSCLLQLGFGVQGTAAGGCRHGSQLDSGETCEVECAPNMVNRGGTTTFSCSAGGLVEATLVCGVQCGPVDASVYASGVESKNGTSGCANVVGELGSGQSCEVQCAKGYQYASGSTKYSCADSYVSFTKPTLQCIPDPCDLPADLGPGMVPADYGPAVVGCSPSAKMDSNTQCFVRCAEGFSYVSGTTFYACKAGTLFLKPSMVCAPQPCTLPPITDVKAADGTEPNMQYVSASSAGPGECQEGLKISSGQTCNVQCASDAYLDDPTGTVKKDGLVILCKEGAVKVPHPCTTTSCKLPSKIGSDVLPARTGVWQGDTAESEADDSLGGYFSAPTSVSTGGPLYGYKYCQANMALKSGGSCVLRCMSGYSHGFDPDKEGHKFSQLLYRCNSNKLSKPTLWCKPDPCKLPVSSIYLPFGATYADKPQVQDSPYSSPYTTPRDPNFCDPTVPLESGQTCMIICQYGYFISGYGTTTFACNAGKMIETPSMKCIKDSCANGNPLKSSCFDYQYPCHTCCTTGLNPEGNPCFGPGFGKTYNKDTCCRSADAPTNAPLAPQSFLPAASGSCAKDPICFDAMYKCDECCSTSVTETGVSCWTKDYTPERCCNKPPPSPTLFQALPPRNGAVKLFSAPPSTCSINATCFDAIYTCEACCATGRNDKGAPCFTKQYSAQACCRKPPTQQDLISEVQLFSMTGKSWSQQSGACSAVDSRGNCLETDSRGFPAFTYGNLHDSRGYLSEAKVSSQISTTAVYMQYQNDRQAESTSSSGSSSTLEVVACAVAGTLFTALIVVGAVWGVRGRKSKTQQAVTPGRGSTLQVQPRALTAVEVSVQASPSTKPARVSPTRS